MTTFADRLRMLVGDSSMASFAKKLEIGATTLQSYLEGSMPRADKAAVIAERAGVDLKWLITGQGNRDSQPPVPQIDLETNREHQGRPMMQLVDPGVLAQEALVLLPQLDVEASAGAGVLVDSEVVMALVAFSERWLRERGITPQAARLLTARGDSMEPTIRSGDILIVDTAINEAVDNGLYVLVYNGVLLVKRLFILRDQSLVISSDNKLAGRDEEVPAHEVDQVHIAGRVMWFGRQV